MLFSFVKTVGLFRLVRFLTLPLLCSGAWQPIWAEEAAAISDYSEGRDISVLESRELTRSGLKTGVVRAVDFSSVDWDLSTMKDGRRLMRTPIDEARASEAEFQADKRYSSLGARMGAAKWEAGAIFAYMTVSQIAVTKETRSFHFQDEGWFGKNTANLGVDKLTHAFNSYLLAELFQARIARKSGDERGAAVPAALLASGLMLYSELFDAHKVSSGFSYQDVAFNTAGAAFSALRNSVPGMKEKIDFRLMLMPNSDIYTFKGKRHYEQQRFLLSLELAGFDKFKNSPFRFLEIQVGYRAKGFTAQDMEKGLPRERKIFYGVGLNIKELFLKSPRSNIGKISKKSLDYIQIPYTAAHVY